MIDLLADPITGDRARHPGHQQLVVRRVEMPDRRDDGRTHGV
jgi:hypothetical protein